MFFYISVNFRNSTVSIFTYFVLGLLFSDYFELNRFHCTLIIKILFRNILLFSEFLYNLLLILILFHKILLFSEFLYNLLLILLLKDDDKHFITFSFFLIFL